MNQQKIEANLEKHRLEEIRYGFLANQDGAKELVDHYLENSYWHKQKVKRWERLTSRPNKRRISS